MELFSPFSAESSHFYPPPAKTSFLLGVSRVDLPLNMKAARMRNVAEEREYGDKRDAYGYHFWAFSIYRFASAYSLGK